MAASYVGLVYDISSKQVRSTVEPDNDRELDDQCYVSPGKTAMMKVPIALYKMLPFDELVAWMGLTR